MKGSYQEGFSDDGSGAGFGGSIGYDLDDYGSFLETYGCPRGFAIGNNFPSYTIEIGIVELQLFEPGDPCLVNDEKEFNDNANGLAHMLLPVEVDWVENFFMKLQNVSDIGQRCEGHTDKACFCCPVLPGYKAVSKAYNTDSGGSFTSIPSEAQYRTWINVACEPGTYSKNYASTDCAKCEANTYQNMSSATTCVDCPVGRFSTEGAVLPKECCVEHAFYDEERQRCVCKAGYYGPDVEKGSNSSDPDWFEDPDVCTRCPDGMTSPAGSTSSGTCSCEEGKGYVGMLTDGRFAGCTPCQPGTKSVVKLFASCETCKAGTYQDQSSQSHCILCDHGKYSSEEGRTEACIDCSSGKYSNEASCYLLVADLIVTRTGEDVDACKNQSADPYVCHISECVDDEDDCQMCGPGTQSIAGANGCETCPAGTGNDDYGGVCNPCQVGTYSNANTAGICQSCPSHHKPDENKTGCEPCPLAQTYDKDINGDECVACPSGFFQYGDYRLNYVDGSRGCFGCNHNKTNQYMDTNDRLCKQCPSGKYTLEDTGILGVEACDPCKSCDPQMYRTGCELDPITDEASDGRCVNCEKCEDDEDGNPQKRVGCINQQGHNDAAGRCERSAFVTRTPLCPFHEYRDGEIERTTQLGLGGFTFAEVFGRDENHTDFQCRLPCDGSRFPYNDTGYCAGPFACNVPSCTMQSDDDTAGLSNLEARGCPQEDILESDGDAAIRTKMGGRCESCDDCSGRGCARECSQLKCELGEIWDFSETRTRNKCKTCQDLTNPALCQSGFYESNLRMTDISGSRPKFRFSGCQPRLATNTFTDVDGELEPHTITYGVCALCDAEAVGECGPEEYHASCDAEIGCLSCHPHGGMEMIASTYRTEQGETRPLYCQVSTCKDPELTGVDEWGVFCEADCGAIVCSDADTELPCLLPHPKRCIAPHPAGRAGQTKVGNVPAHANLLERLESTHLFANFENLLMPLASTPPEHRHQCVWNAQGITDNDVNPGGVAHSFLPHDEVFATNQLADGTKFCHPWPNRDMSLQYPLRPLQNTVTDIVSVFPRRVLVNTSARVMDYAYTGDGYTANDFDVPDVTVSPGPSTEFTGSFFLDLDVTRAPRATLAVFVPDDRNLDTVSWVPQWELSVLVRESTLATTLPNLKLTLDVPALKSKLGLDMTVFMKNNQDGKQTYVYNVWDASKLTPGSEAAYDGVFNARPRLFSSPNQTAYVHVDEVPGTPATSLPSFMLMGTVEAISRPSDHVMDVDITAIAEGVVTSMASGFGAYHGCYSTETTVACLKDDYTVDIITSTTHGDVIQSISVWEDMLVVTRQRSDSSTLSAKHEFWNSDKTVNPVYQFPVPGVLCTVGVDAEIWAIEVDSDAVMRLQSHTQIDFNGKKHFQPGLNHVITANQRYATQVKDLVSIGVVASYAYDRIFVLVPVKSSSGELGEVDEVVLLVRMYSKDGDPLTSTDVKVDSAWSFYQLLLGRASYTSRAWRDDATVLVGFMGGVYEIDCSGPAAVVTSIASSYLNNFHFTLVQSGFLALDTQPVQDATSLTCATGFQDVTVSDDGVLKDGYSRTRCAHACFIDTACVVYAMRGGECRHYATENAGGVKGCKRKRGSTSKDLYLTHQRGSAHTSSKATFKALLRGFVAVSGEESALGYHALTEGLENDYSGIQFQYVPYSIRYSGEKVALMDVGGEDGSWQDRMVGIYGAETTEIQSFQDAFDADGNAMSLEYVSLRYNYKAVIVLDLCAAGAVKLWTSSDEITETVASTSDCHQRYVVVFNKAYEIDDSDILNVVITQKIDVCYNNGCVEYTKNVGYGSIYTEIRLFGDASIIKIVQSESETEFDLRALTWPTNVRTSNITGEWARKHRYFPGDIIRTAPKPFPVFLHVDGGTRYPRSVSLDALQFRPVLTVSGTEESPDAVFTRFYLPTQAELDQLGLGAALTGDDISSWMRLHITVGVDSGDLCRFSLVEVDDDGEEKTTGSVFHVDRLREIGCTTAEGQCHLEVPYAFRDTNTHHWVGLKANLTERCAASNVEAWIAPLTSLWECGANSFWSEDEQRCRECETDDILAFSCPDGQFVRGCTALMDLGSPECINCDNAGDKNTKNRWAPGMKCVLECIEGETFGTHGVCSDCPTTFSQVDCSALELDATTQRGWQFQACTKTENATCVPCPEVQKSIFSNNEQFVQDPSGNTVCNTTCKDGFYRDMEPPFYCRPCHDLDMLKTNLEFVREFDAFYRFRGCAKFSNAQAQKCAS